MTIWENLTLEEGAVLEAALVEGFINGVIPDFLGKSYNGGAVWISETDVDRVRPYIPKFRNAVLRMIREDLIELRVAPDGDWDAAPQLTSDEIADLLAHDNVWDAIPNDDTIMVMIMTTERADALLAGKS